jgi:hypothetical protein
VFVSSFIHVHLQHGLAEDTPHPLDQGASNNATPTVISSTLNVPSPVFKSQHPQRAYLGSPSPSVFAVPFIPPQPHLQCVCVFVISHLHLQPGFTGYTPLSSGSSTHYMTTCHPAPSQHHLRPAKLYYLNAVAYQVTRLPYRQPKLYLMSCTLAASCITRILNVGSTHPTRARLARAHTQPVLSSPTPSALRAAHIKRASNLSTP